ncbi:S-adenosyl-L-methionine-dependent methyltransferase [Phycomyces blakesleeanus]
MSSSTISFETINGSVTNIKGTDATSALKNKGSTACGRAYHNAETGTYILPCDDDEKKRLNLKHNIFKIMFDGLTVPAVKHNFAPGSKVLDIACGTGIWTMEMAQAYPDCTFIGIDMADVFPKENVPPNVEFKIVNASDLSEFEDNTFGLVHTRLLIAGFPADKWIPMIKEIYRIVAPGGLVQFLEYDFISGPKQGSILKVITSLYFAITERNNDFFIPQKLAPYLLHSGFDVILEDNKKQMFSSEEDNLSKMILQNWIEALDGFKPFMIPHLCPENPEAFDSIIDIYIKDCIEHKWFLNAVIVVGAKPLIAE